MPQIPLIKGDSISKDFETDYRDALPVNMYAVEREILGASGNMLCSPGLSQVAYASGADRGAVYNERLNDHFRVSGGSFVSIDGGTSTTLGSIPGTSQAAMPYSFNTQAVVVDGKYFLYDPTAGFRQVNDDDLGSPIDATWIDGYYFFTDGEYLFHTDINDEGSIDPLKFATAEFSPDPTLGVAKTQDNKVIAFGRYSIEYFVNQATENFAFQRVGTRAQKIGIVATHAKCEASNGSWYITGSRKRESLGVYLIGVGSAGKVSTREVDKILATYTEPELSDMRMESRTEDNVTFITVHLPGNTLEFNETISQVAGIQSAWSIKKTGTMDATYRAINGVLDARTSQWIYGDKVDGRIGLLDKTIFTQYDEVQEWLLYTPFVNLETLSIDALELEIIPGDTNETDATIAVSTTYNGRTYGKEHFVLYGAPYDYSQRLILYRLGYVDDWVGFKFRGATRSRMSFAFLNIEAS